MTDGTGLAAALGGRLGECGHWSESYLTRGMCQRCYDHWRRKTPPDQRPTPPTRVDNFDEFVDRSGGPSACWPWTGATDPKGYGRHRKRFGTGLAHRQSLFRYVGPPEDPNLYACHRCDNPPCVNPAHLYWGTHLDNTHDAMARGRIWSPPRKTHCPQGHAYEGDNLAIVGAKRERICRTCSRASKRKSERKRRAARRAAS